MADDVEIKFGADADPALSAIAELRDALGSLTPALSAFSDGAVRSFDRAMQTLVDLKGASAQQVLAIDIQYTTQLRDQEAQRLQATIAGDAATLDDKIAAYDQMSRLDGDYTDQVIEDQSRMLRAAQRQADAVARSYESGFDRLGGTVQRTFNQILMRQITWSKGSRQLTQQVEGFFLDRVENMGAKWAASGLGSLAGGAVASAVGGAQATGATGLGAGLMALIGLNQPGGLLGTGLFSGAGGTIQATAVTANTTALTASTAAITALTATLGGTAAASGAAAIGGIGAAAAGGAAAGGGGFFSWLGGLFAFAKGGIVPSAAGGWALPNFAGATPALLHAREMVLPAPISEGLQDMIGRGAAGGAHFHAHFHGPADAPAISRWFRDNMRQNAGVIRDMFRQNALTPRSL